MPKQHTKMLVCINYGFKHQPSIKYINYDSDDLQCDVERIGSYMKQDYDEVYVIDIQPFNQEFIKEIQKHGKKL